MSCTAATTAWRKLVEVQNERTRHPQADPGLPRDSIYIDRSKKYLNMALKRLGLQEQKLKRMVDTVQFQIFGVKEGDEL